MCCVGSVPVGLMILRSVTREKEVCFSHLQFGRSRIVCFVDNSTLRCRRKGGWFGRSQIVSFDSSFGDALGVFELADWKRAADRKV
jgi:hypothetical protein